MPIENTGRAKTKMIVTVEGELIVASASSSYEMKTSRQVPSDCDGSKLPLSSGRQSLR